MPKDYAGRGRAASKTQRNKKKQPAKRRSSQNRRVLFHGPSFSSGALIGAAVVIIAAYAPELLNEASDNSSTAEQAGLGATDPAAETKLKFEFPDMLRDTEVATNPDTYKVPAQQTTPPAGGYHIQAASFRSERDAEQLRARLLLLDLPTQRSVNDDTGPTWHRVVVGPFARKVEADRAMTKLREQNLSPMWLNSHN
jgi:cell division protein FtsN